MNKKKSAFVTFIIFGMLLLIDLGLYFLFLPGFVIITGMLALYGLVRSFMDFREWLDEDEPVSVDLITAPKGKLYDWERDELAEGAATVAEDEDKRTIDDILSEFRAAAFEPQPVVE